MLQKLCRICTVRALGWVSVIMILPLLMILIIVVITLSVANITTPTGNTYIVRHKSVLITSFILSSHKIQRTIFSNIILFLLQYFNNRINILIYVWIHQRIHINIDTFQLFWCFHLSIDGRINRRIVRSFIGCFFRCFIGCFLIILFHLGSTVENFRSKRCQITFNTIRFTSFNNFEVVTEIRICLR